MASNNDCWQIRTENWPQTLKKLNNWCNVGTPKLNTNGLYTSNATATLKKPNLGQQG